MEEVERLVTATIPLGRLNEAEDVADLIGFLVSERARQITGQAVNVGGEMNVTEVKLRPTAPERRASRDGAL